MPELLQDPVCGMWVNEDTAAARIALDDELILFCAAGCHRAYLRDPGRYAGAAGSATRGVLPRTGAAARIERRCAVCGDAALVGVTDEQHIGRRTIDECVALVRAEWRHRLGHRAYAREHPARLIRTVLVYALVPDSPVRQIAIQEELILEVARLRADGLSRAQMRRELYHLFHAAAKVVAGSDLEPVSAAEMVEALDRLFHEATDREWPQALTCTAVAGSIMD